MKMFYSAYTNQGNVGDLLITKYQIEEYAKYGEVYVDCHGMPDSFCRVIFDTQSTNIKNFEKEYGLSYRSSKILKVLYTINKDHFTHFCSSPGPKMSLKLSLKTLLFKLMGAIIPELMLNKRIKKLAIGVDVKYENNNILSQLNHWYFNRYDLIGLRSKNNYYSLEQTFKNVRYVPDMAFLYPHFDAKLYQHANKKIAFSFRKITEYKSLVKALFEMIRTATENELHVDLIYQVDEDKTFCEHLLRMLDGTSINPCIRRICFDNLNIYQQYDMVISNRLHVLLMAAMNGAVPYALISHDSKENKIKEIFESVFSSNFVNYIDEFEKDNFGNIVYNIEDLKSELLDDIIKQRQLCVKSFENLFQSNVK